MTMVGDRLNSISTLNKGDPLAWIQQQIADNANPRTILSQLIPELTLPDHVDEMSLWRLAFEILSEPPLRQRLTDINSLEHVKNLIQDCKNIVVLTGAGVSVSCGIPDFRSRDGIYARLSKDYPDLPDPQSMFDIQYFRSNQWPFFKFAKEIYPGQFTPSLCHRFISYLDKTGRLLRNYSQNIDTLEQVAGIKNVVQCHGSFATATCMNCKFKVTSDVIKTDIFEQKIPYCTKCTVHNEDGKLNILKPDIVFFGESLPQSFHRQIQEDKNKADLLIVIGSSLKVRPVSLIPSLIKPNVPQILINREPLNHLQFDVELYGNCDDVIAEVCTQLGSDWTDIIGNFVPKPLDNEKLELLFNQSNTSTDENTEDESEKLKQNEDDVKLSKDSIQEGDLGKIGNSQIINIYENTEDNNCKPNGDDLKLVNGISKESIAKDDIRKEEIDLDMEQDISKDNTKVNNRNEKEHDLKRKCDCGDEEQGSSIKKKKTIEIDGNEEIFYLSLPPNRYLFYGAELDMDDDSDSESDTENIVSDNNIKKPLDDNDGIPTCANKPLDDNDGIPTCANKPLDDNDDIPTCANKPLDDNDGIPTCANKPLDDNDDIPTCANKPLDDNDDIPTCANKPLDDNDDIPTCANKPLDDNDDIPTCANKPLDDNDGIPTCANKPLDDNDDIPTCANKPLDDNDDIPTCANKPLNINTECSNHEGGNINILHSSEDKIVNNDVKIEESGENVSVMSQQNNTNINESQSVTI